MRKYDELWNDINTLLTYLRGGAFEVAELMDERFNAIKLTDACFLEKYGNEAPGILLRQQMAKLQKRLDEAPTNREDRDE